MLGIIIAVNITIVVFIIVVLFLWHLKRRNEYWKNRNVPFEPATLLFGNMVDNVTGKKSMSDVFEQCYNKYKGYKYVGFMNYGTPGLIIRDPDLVTEILVKDFPKYADNAIKIDEKNDPVFSKNPGFAKGNRWKQIRAQLTPQFTPMKIKLMFPLMTEVKDGLIKYLNEAPEATGKDGLNAKELCLKYTTDMVASCAFGLNGNSFDNKNAVFCKLLKEVFSFGYTDGIVQLSVMLFPGLYKVHIPTMLSKKVTNKFKQIILDTVAEREKNNIRRGDFLDAIIEMKQKTTAFDYTSDYMTAHAMSFFMDGVETSALVLQYALYEVAANKDVQEKLRTEFEEMLEKTDGNLTHDALFELKYLDMIIKETLRKHPPLPIMLKETTETTTLPSPITGSPALVLERGTAIFVPSKAIQNDSDYFEDPDKFIPERFADDSQDDRPKHAYLPFGDGPRICIGRWFGVAQIKVALLAIITNFDVSVNAKTPKKFVMPPNAFFNNVVGGIWLNFYPRKTNKE